MNDFFLYLAIDTVFHPSGIIQNGRRKLLLTHMFKVLITRWNYGDNVTVVYEEDSGGTDGAIAKDDITVGGGAFGKVAKSPEVEIQNIYMSSDEKMYDVDRRFKHISKI